MIDLCYKIYDTQENFVSEDGNLNNLLVAVYKTDSSVSRFKRNARGELDRFELKYGVLDKNDIQQLGSNFDNIYSDCKPYLGKILDERGLKSKIK